MTLITILANKFLTLIGQGELVTTQSSSRLLFAILAVVSIVCGLKTIANRYPVLTKYNKYTKESVTKAATLLGITDIIIGVLDIIYGVLPMTAALSLPICIAAGAGMAALIAMSVVTNKKLVKKTKA